MATGKGQKKLSVWDRCSADLVTRRSRFRLRRRPGSPWIYVRELVDGEQLQLFSTLTYRLDDDAHVEAIYRRCLASHDAGVWIADQATHKGVALDWEAFARLVAENLRLRVPREASRSHSEAHLRAIAKFAGKVSAERLERWAEEVDPITAPSSFRHRLETLGQIQASAMLDLSSSIETLKAKRPAGSARKRQQQQTQRPRAIPTDAALQEWLDGLDGHLQWTFALIATYGLRPSEAWHAEGIDAKGWITIPGEGRTKTRRHYAPPVPSHWVARYWLREHFSKYQGELLKRWPLRWEERDGQQVPVNNSGVASYLAKLQVDRPQPSGAIYPAQVKPLLARAADGEGTDWVRPYDLRHSYAIRCFTDPAVNTLRVEDHAAWLGHGCDVHERIYLRWLPRDRQKMALQERHAAMAANDPQQQEPSTSPQELPPEVLARLAKLEKLEALLQG